MLDFLRRRARTRINERLCRHVRSRLKKIQVVPTQGLFNFRCFENAVEYQRTHPDLRLYEVIYIDQGDPILHYVNYDPVACRFLETTLGWRADTLDYFLVREIEPENYQKIHDEFNRALEGWNDQYLSWFARRVLGIDRVV